MPKSYPLSEPLCSSVYALGLAINRTYQPLLDELSITYPQYLVLSVLWEGDHLPIGEIGNRLSLESTLTPLLKRLEGLGLVTRQRNPQNERQVIISLNEAGISLESRAPCLNIELAAASSVTGLRLSTLNDEVRALREALELRRY